MSITKDCDDKWTGSDALDRATLFFRLLNHARALEAMLVKGFEHGHIGGDSCVICGTYSGHSPDCQLAKLLEGVEGVEDSHK